MATLRVSKNSTLRLPSQGADAKYTVGVGWDPAQPGADKVDLDIWVVRHRAGKKGEPVCWANGDLERPDLGQNSEGNPYLATAEMDVVHKGDDTSGAVSDGDHDETVDLDLSLAPADVERYEVYITYFEEPDMGTGATLGMASNIVCDLIDHKSGHTARVELADVHGFDVTAHIATIGRDAGGSWTITNKDDGYPESMFALIDQLDIDA